jgi:hypothetical protein
MAIRLATHPEDMKALKCKLADHRLATRLFDTDLYVRGLEAGYHAIHERYHAGLKPDHIDIGD